MADLRDRPKALLAVEREIQWAFTAFRLSIRFKRRIPNGAARARARREKE